MNKAPPFPNKYNIRLVAANDSKSCTICYKPSTTVLVSDNQADFFYTCPQHLLDEHFATPIQPQSYLDLVKQKEELEAKKTQLEKDIELEKPYLWNKVSEYWQKSDNKKEKSKFEKLNDELKQVIEQLSDKQKEVSEFKFKVYKLNLDIYKNRLMLTQKKKYQKERYEKMHSEGFFPSAPKNDIA
ncbi:uncharacterized protein SPAPADRAFT_70142 [Spathaspora passalidarum NRRL Y-27907]|uniref:DUF1742-domain-containing protein n=1 Tax=Spathaspora passalidarum (strain NRRL Y-27907 / 11-Y1) TaxID=619300 RepID=G3AJJ3_SPAPN|nr:uncharacterized protein SPAPADRAFT_70142 [Spathaspora passalidarum NRRL Y-27907]EGW33896.1 hypothetical protein SPAPADRAFT_70142 [Spathaspora passalidarum NRRL Y-27907]